MTDTDRTTMTLREAKEAIAAILASIPDYQLPEFDEVEYNRDGKPCVWYGGTGYTLGSATKNGKRDPLVHRRSAAWGAIEREMVCRADQRLFDNGDNPAGIEFASATEDDL